MSAHHHTLASGTRIDCFEIGRVLGVGGFGVTYQGYDHTLSCDVAIKEYLPSGVGLRASDGITVVPKSDQDQELYSYGLDRFLEEARILAKFKAPSIVRVTRFLESNGTAYLIMDYEDGQPLSAHLKAHGCPAEGRLLPMVRELLMGLRQVHTKGYLHRDIKPGNIYLRKDGSPVLLDFGSARQAVRDRSTAITSMVTPGYAPIEQYNTMGRQGPWTDLYGLGATLYRCITDQNPVGAPERVMALQAGDEDPLAAARSMGRARYNEDFLDTIDWMLKPNIADRPQAVDAVLHRLYGGAPQEDKAGDPAGVDDAQEIVDLISTGTLRSDDLETATRNLAAHIGPMARVLVKSASIQARDLSQLYTLLSESIPSPSAREKFLKMAEGRTTRPDPGPQSTRSPVSSARDRPAGLASTGVNPITGPRPLTDEFIARAERALAAQVGPLARMLVRQAAAQAGDTGAFIDLLEREIGSDSGRQQFREALRR